MLDSSLDAAPPALTQSLVRGALVNAVGSAGKLLFPLFLLLITRIYGPSTVGIFLLTLSIVELVSCLAIEGFDAGVVTFGSRSAGDDEHDVYRVTACALHWSLLLSLGAAGLAAAARALIADTSWDANGLGTAVGVTAIVLPLMAVTYIPLAATRSGLAMKYDALVNGFVKPAALIAAGTALGLRAPTLRSLSLAYIAAQVVCAAAAVAVMLRMFSGRRLLAHVIRYRPVPGLFAFGISSGFGSLSNALTANAPIVILGTQGIDPAAIAFFGTALMIVSNMRQIRFVFSTSFAPLAARLHAQARHDELADAYAAATRWSLALTVPLVLLFGLFRHEVMTFIHASYRADTAFILLLLIIPVLRCSLAGTALLAAGRAGWSLANNLACGVVTVAGMWLLVPGFGLVGAAAAASAGVVVITIAELIETRQLLGLPLNPARRPRPRPPELLAETDRSSPYPSAPY